MAPPLPPTTPARAHPFRNLLPEFDRASTTALREFDGLWAEEKALLEALWPGDMPRADAEAWYADTGKPAAISLHRKRLKQLESAPAENSRMLQLLDHASQCHDDNCEVRFCPKMKALLAHAPECQVRIAGGCAQCNRFWRLLSLHAKQCDTAACKITHCDRIKTHLEQNQAMP